MTAVSAQTQDGVAGTAVKIVPAVKIIDGNGAGVAGVNVTFAVAAGGGILTGPTPVTDQAGVATVGSWTLGPSAGSNSLVASASGVTPITFSAQAAAAPVQNVCPAPATLAVGSAPGGALSANSCLVGGFHTDVYTFVQPAVAGVSFALTSGAFDAYLRVLDAGGHLVAENDNASGGTNSLVRTLLPAGNYRIEVRAATPTAVGQYIVSASVAPMDAFDCSPVYVAPGLVTTQSIALSDCAIGTTSGDTFLLHLDAGQTVTLTWNDFFTASLQVTVFGPDGSIVNQKNSATTSSMLLSTAASGYYKLQFTHVGLFAEFGYQFKLQ